MRGLPLIALVSATALVIGAAAMLAPRGKSQLLAGDDGPAGLSAARQMLEATPHIDDVRTLIASPLALAEDADPSRTLLVIAGAERPYMDDEVDQIVDFQRAGGSLLVLDKTQGLSRLAAQYGVLIDGREIISPRSDGPYLPLVVAFPGESNRTLDVRLFRPTSLGIVPDWQRGTIEVLGATEPDAVIDADRDGQITPTGDIAGSFELIVMVHPDEGGGVAFVADPIAFTNSLFSDAQNRALLSGLVRALLPDGGDVVFDESRHAQPASLGPEAMRLVLVALAGWRGIAVSAALVAAAAVVAVRHKGLAPYGHVFAPETIVPVPKNEEELSRLVSGTTEETKP